MALKPPERDKGHTSQIHNISWNYPDNKFSLFKSKMHYLASRSTRTQPMEMDKVKQSYYKGNDLLNMWRQFLKGLTVRENSLPTQHKIEEIKHQDAKNYFQQKRKTLKKIGKHTYTHTHT
jgi:hypothetical protein